MADKEKNMPTQEPESQGNINELQSVPPEENSDEIGMTTPEEAVDAVEEKDGVDVPALTDEEPLPADESLAEEEVDAEEQPIESESVETPESETFEGDEEPEEISSESVEMNDADDADESSNEEEQPESDEATDDEEMEFTIGEDGELELKDSENEEETDEQYSSDEDEFVDPEDLVIHDEVVEAIKAEGARLENNELSLKTYIIHSKKAIKNFESALATGQKALDENRDEKEVPVILAGIIKISGKLLEIKCNNLENIVRVKAYNYIKELRTALHMEIDRYNDLVINYASVTGEQLTRLSTFLPENIASGKSLAVVPELLYKENYVQFIPDADKSREDAITTMVITPAVTAEAMLSEIPLPRSRSACSSYSKKIKRATSRLNKECTKLNKLLNQTKTSRKRYESELASLEKRSTLAERATREYKDKVFAINMKYGKQLVGIGTLKTKSAFARTRLRLLVNRFALEREKLVIAYQCLRTIHRSGSYDQRKAAEKQFANAIIAYNQCAERCSKVTGTHFDQFSPSIVELACRGDEIVIPVIAYKRELVEKVGDNVRVISMTLISEVAPNEEAYNENSGKILEKHGMLKNTSTLSDESAVVDRASAIARVMLDALKESADLVHTADEFEQFDIKSQKAIKYFKKALKYTEKAISKAFDEHGVVTALVENLRVIANLIEVRRLCITVCMKLNREDLAKMHGRALYKNIELYNGRAIDYMSIVGEQFSRITTATSKELMTSADKIKVPVITYKDNYIEVFPKDPLKDSTYEKPRLWRAGVYTPLLMQHYRLTENRAVETTVVNSPFVFDVIADDMPAVSWWHPIGFGQHLMVWAQPIVAWWHRVCTNIEIWFVDESLLFSKSGLAGRQNKNDKKKAKYEQMLKKLNEEHAAKLLALETVVHESDRHSASYQKKLYNINAKFSRKVYNLKLRWMEDCTGHNATRLLLEKLVIERGRLAGINKVLIKYRSYGRITFTKNILGKYKRKFIDAINAHNATAKKLSEVLGVQFAEVSTSVADEIIRYGNMIKFPEIVCCREVIETVDGKQRTVGDRWHGYGVYTGSTGASGDVKGNSPIMSVGAMGYATDMGIPFLKADFDGMTILGMTPGGVPLIGFTANGETSIPFTGTPMMLSGTDGGIVLDAGMVGQGSLILGAANVTDPYSGISKRGVDENDTDEKEENAKDLHSGCEVETPLDIEAKMIEERFIRALRARSMTSVDDTSNWWKLIGSEINVSFMRKLILNPRGFLRFLVPPKDTFVETVNTMVSEKDDELLRQIAKVGSVIDIECKRLYSATKTGIRRSQRVWSGWLHEDIELYNKLVKEYNSGRDRYMHIDPLSLNIPDTIIFRKTDRPPAPPRLSLRNRVKIDDTKTPITTDDIYNNLVEYAQACTLRYSTPLQRFWAKVFTIPSLSRSLKKGKRGSALPAVSKWLSKRTAKTYLRRQSNEYRHYRIRYEKARAMKRYNRRTLKAIGIANDPIKYQAKVHKVLRDYLATNFRIDYNMRIRQLVYRGLRVDFNIYWIVTLALATVIAIAALFMESSPALQVLVMVGILWAALPIYFILLRIVYEIVMLVASFFLLFRNIVLIKYGARDVERNRYGAILDCFVTEQYRLLLACERFLEKPNKGSLRKALIATVNDYNKRAEVYSEILRVPIKSVELTGLIDKLSSGERHYLTEIQNFVYVRELVERVDTHERGKTLNARELTELVGEINHIINSINLAGSNNQIAVDFLQGAMQKLISYLQTGIKPTQNQKFELKRDLIQGISQFDIGVEKKEIFSRDVIKVVDQLGGKDSRRIISILAEDNMIN